MSENAPHAKQDSVGWFVKGMRRELGLTQEQLAQRIGTSREYLSQIEGGRPKWPQRYIPQLAAALGVSERRLAIAAGKISNEPPEAITYKEFRKEFPGADREERFSAMLIALLVKQGAHERSLSGVDGIDLSPQEFDELLEWVRSQAEFELSEDVVTEEDGSELPSLTIRITSMSDALKRVVEVADLFREEPEAEED